MIKKHTTLSIDNEVLEKAKERGINMSDVAERALQKQLGIVEAQMDTDSPCGFCGEKEDMATTENLEGMTWLCPDEMWICSVCLRNKIEKLKATTH